MPDAAARELTKLMEAYPGSITVSLEASNIDLSALSGEVGESESVKVRWKAELQVSIWGVFPDLVFGAFREENPDKAIESALGQLTGWLEDEGRRLVSPEDRAALLADLKLPAVDSLDPDQGP